MTTPKPIQLELTRCPALTRRHRCEGVRQGSMLPPNPDAQAAAESDVQHAQNRRIATRAVQRLPRCCIDLALDTGDGQDRQLPMPSGPKLDFNPDHCPRPIASGLSDAESYSV